MSFSRKYGRKCCWAYIWLLLGWEGHITAPLLSQCLPHPKFFTLLCLYTSITSKGEAAISSRGPFSRFNLTLLPFARCSFKVILPPRELKSQRDSWEEAHRPLCWVCPALTVLAVSTSKGPGSSPHTSLIGLIGCICSRLENTQT